MQSEDKSDDKTMFSIGIREIDNVCEPFLAAMTCLRNSGCFEYFLCSISPLGDEIWGLFSTKEERDNNMMKIYSIASRHNGSFPDFVARCYLECCFFTSQDDDIN